MHCHGCRVQGPGVRCAREVYKVADSQHSVVLCTGAVVLSPVTQPVAIVMLYHNDKAVVEMAIVLQPGEAAKVISIRGRLKDV